MCKICDNLTLTNIITNRNYMFHVDIKICIQFPSNEFTSMTLRGIGFTAHYSYMISFAISINKPFESTLKSLFFSHQLIIIITFFIKAIIICRATTNYITHICILYILVL